MENKFDISLYNDEFFAWHARHVHQSSVECGKILAKEMPIRMKSVVDFGCGIGSFLEGFKQFYPYMDVKGYEIGYDAALPYISKDIVDFISKKDITAHMDKLLPYDLALCMEVAEHIETDKSEILVGNLCRMTSQAIIFTAAPPDQLGTGHINCQPKEFWIDLFKQKGWTYGKQSTKNVIRLWKNVAADYYLNNLMVFENLK